MKVAAATVVFLSAALLFAPAGRAHKGITSKFTFNVDVYPVFLNRCGRCHIDGGVGPMSLLKYEDAFPWAESLRTELLSAYPDGAADPHDFIRAAHRQISARELDIVLDWATGGTPEGDKANAPSPPAFTNDWAAGTPSLLVPMPSRYEMPANQFETTQEFVMKIPAAVPLTASDLDLLPGNPSIVRSAAISLVSPDGTTRLIGTWFPRQTAAPIALKPPARIEPGARIVLRIHYKKTWKFEGEAMSDQSTVGLYAAE
jgi:hypothetical protein